jgi:adenosylcobinamide-GDP ribazoletransferase
LGRINTVPLSRVQNPVHPIEGSIMPPLVYETAAWLRLYTCLPIPALPGEPDPLAVPDPARTAHAAPLAGAIVGAIGGLVLILVWELGATDFTAAAFAVVALVALTGGRAERALDAITGRHGADTDFHLGMLAAAVALLLRAGALTGLVVHGVWGAAFALAGACAVSRALACAFVLMRPAGNPGDANTSALQWLAIGALLLGALTVLPFHGFGATIAAFAAAAGAAALLTAFVSREAIESNRNFTATTELVAEIAFLIAVLAFAGNP